MWRVHILHTLGLQHVKRRLKLSRRLTSYLQDAGYAKCAPATASPIEASPELPGCPSGVAVIAVTDGHSLVSYSVSPATRRCAMDEHSCGSLHVSLSAVQIKRGIPTGVLEPCRHGQSYG